MKRFVLGALAVSAASTLGNASESEDWAGLDRELETLRATMAASQSGSAVGASGFIRSSYLWSKDARGGNPPGSASASPLSGFSLDNVRLNLSATVDEFDVFVQLEASSKPAFNGAAPAGSGYPGFGGFAPATPVQIGGAVGNRLATTRVGTGFGPIVVLDAYASWNIQDEIKLTVGQFRAPVVRGALKDEDSLFFLERSANDFLWATRDQGAMLSGQVGIVSYAAGVQNGGMHPSTDPTDGTAGAGDGVGDELAYFGRVDVNILGDGPGKVEGALGASEDLSISVGASYFKDESVKDSIAWATDLIATFDFLSVSSQFMAVDDAYTASQDSEFLWNVAGTVMIVPDKWEVGIRFEEFDDAFAPASMSGARASANQVTFGVNHYINGTHNAKVSANYSHVHARSRALIDETDLFAVGLTLSW